MRIFVVGAGGFIGSHIADYLSGVGHDVRSHVRSEAGNLIPDMIPEDTEVIVNAAGRLGSKEISNEQLTMANALLPGMLGEYCGESGTCLVHLSTPGVTGLAAGGTEDMDYAPWGEYERTKTLGEKNLLANPWLQQDRCTILRPDFVYGPGDTHKLPLFRQVASGWMPLIGRNGASVRPTFCHDVSRAVEESLPGGRLSGGIFNIAGSRVVTVRELAITIALALETKLRFLPMPALFYRVALLLGPLCPSALSRSRLRLFGEDHFVSIDKAAKAGFSPAIELEAGIGETVQWYRQNGMIG